MCDSILATLMKMQPYYSQSIRKKSDPVHWHIPISLLVGSTTPPPPGVICVKKLGRPLIRPAIFECMSLGLVTPDTSLRKSKMLG